MTKEEFFNLMVGDLVVYTNTGSTWEVDYITYLNDERTPHKVHIKCYDHEMDLTFENKWRFELE